MPERAEAVTFRYVSEAPWPDEGFDLGDGRKVIEFRSNGNLYGRGLYHLCLDDGTCVSGRPDEVVPGTLVPNSDD